MHGGSLNAPSALRFGQAATRVLCSKLSPAGVRKASRLNSCFNLVPIYKRNQRGFLLRPLLLPSRSLFFHNSAFKQSGVQESQILEWKLRVVGGGVLGHHFYGGHWSEGGGVGGLRKRVGGGTWKRIQERKKKGRKLLGAGESRSHTRWRLGESGPV